MMTFAVLHFCIFNFADFTSITCKIILNTILIIIIATAVFESQLVITFSFYSVEDADNGNLHAQGTPEHSLLMYFYCNRTEKIMMMNITVIRI